MLLLLPTAMHAPPQAELLRAGSGHRKPPSTFDVQMTSRRWMFIQESQFTTWPL